MFSVAKGKDCTHGNIELVGGSSASEGLVKVCFQGYWIAVCSSSWTSQHADVVCHQLGFPVTGRWLIIREW